MKYTNILSGADHEIISNRLRGFVPSEVYDIHAHPYSPSHFSTDAWPWLQPAGELGCRQHQDHLLNYMPTRIIHGLYFGMPHRSAQRDKMNEWILEQTRLYATAQSRTLKVVAPGDDRAIMATELRSGLYCGIKVYHIYAERPDTMNASISEYAPEWMWEILHEVNGVMMLHIVRNGAIDDADNQRELKRLCRNYPNVKVVLAHIARSFNYRNARHGMRFIEDIENVVVDTSAVCETESFKAALKYLGPKRILWGSDFAVSEMRGRCVTTGSYFYWLHPEIIHKGNKPPTDNEMTLVGIESLLSLREACEDVGLTTGDIQDIFLNNALRLLKPHLPATAVPRDVNAQAMWENARTKISGGTGLLSKRAEMYDPETWPSYFSRCSGCEVWDINNRRYIDFAGGIGAVLLGYADPDVTAAINRRLMLGTYCSLVNPQELELAGLLLGLHPWAGRLRYARSGGEAMAIAVRIARAATGKSGIAFCGYHGWHDWYLAANVGEINALDGHLLPGLDPHGVPRELAGTAQPFRYNDLASLDDALEKLKGKLAAIVMEPMRAQEPKDDFIAKVKEKCAAAGAVFIVDEITSGLRYGFPGALARTGIDPDIVVYAKAMSNGIPFATIIGREDVMQKGESGFISSSYWTDGVGTAAALAVLKKMQQLDVFNTVWEKGRSFQERLKAMALFYPACNISIGGLPATPTISFQLADHSKLAHQLYVRKMQEQGFLVSSIFYLMLAHDQEHIDQLMSALEKVFAEMEELIKNEGMEAEVGCKQSTAGFARLA